MGGNEVIFGANTVTLVEIQLHVKQVHVGVNAVLYRADTVIFEANNSVFVKI